MANLSIRKLDDKILVRLRDRAALHRVSMEEETRQILKQAVSTPQRIGEVALRIFGRAHGVVLKLPKHKAHEPMELFK